MPVNARLTEFESRDLANVEAAKLGPPLARRHVHAGHFGQVLVGSGAGHLIYCATGERQQHRSEGDPDRKTNLADK
jgi:hypothetical protein